MGIKSVVTKGSYMYDLFSVVVRALYVEAVVKGS
jgi:hypothetical protein